MYFLLCIMLAMTTASSSEPGGIIVQFEFGKVYEYSINSHTQLGPEISIKLNAEFLVNRLGTVNSLQKCTLNVTYVNIKGAKVVRNGGDDMDFSNWFLFLMSNAGEVVSVIYPKNESSEIVNFKKVFLSFLSARIHERKDANAWSYQVNETTIDGKSLSQYHVTRGESYTTVKKMKKNHLVENADFSYQQTMTHCARDGVIKHIDFSHYFASPNKVAKRFKEDDDDTLHEPPHTYRFKGDTYEFPKMEGKSSGSVRLRRVLNTSSKETILNTHDAVHDKLTTTQIEHFKIDNYTLLSSALHGNLTCLKDKTPPESPVRSTCFKNTIAMLRVLTENGVQEFASEFLARADDDKMKETILSCIGALKTNQAQTIILNYVFKSQSMNIRLMHGSLLDLLSAQGNILPTSVKTMEQLAFAKGRFKALYQDAVNRSDKEADILHDLKKRALLVLGAALNYLSKSYKKEKSTDCDSA